MGFWLGPAIFIFDDLQILGIYFSFVSCFYWSRVFYKLGLLFWVWSCFSIKRLDYLLKAWCCIHWFICWCFFWYFWSFNGCYIIQGFLYTVAGFVIIIIMFFGAIIWCVSAPCSSLLFSFCFGLPICVFLFVWLLIL